MNNLKFLLVSIFVLSLCFCVLSASANENNNGLLNSLEIYHTMDDADIVGSTVIDRQGHANLTITGGATGANVILGEALAGTGTYNYDFSSLMRGDFSVNLWMKGSSFDGRFFDFSDSSNYIRLQGYSEYGQVCYNYYFDELIGGNAGHGVSGCANPPDDGNPHMITLTSQVNGQNKIYIDGVWQRGNFPDINRSAITTIINPVNVGGGDKAIDEMGWWRKILSAADVAALYNGGLGLSYSSFDSIPHCSADTDCPTCQKCEGGSCLVELSTEDTKNECVGEACASPSSYFDYTGVCNGNGRCSYNVVKVSPGHVCINSTAINVPPTESIHCGIWKDCVANQSYANQYYVGYDAGYAGSNNRRCDATDWQSTGSSWTVPTGFYVSQDSKGFGCNMNPFDVNNNDLLNNLELYHTMDNADIVGSTIIDKQGNGNLTFTGGSGASLKLGEAFSCVNDDYATYEYDFNELARSDFSVNFWMKSGTLLPMEYWNIFSYQNSTTYADWWFVLTEYNGNERMYYEFYLPEHRSRIDAYDSSYPLSNGNPHMITITSQNNGLVKLYMDGIEKYVSNEGDKSVISSIGPVLLCNPGFRPWTGQNLTIDEMGWWKDRILSDTDVATLYNGSSGLAYTSFNNVTEAPSAVDNYVWVTGYSNNVAKVDKTTLSVTNINVGASVRATYGVAVDPDFVWVGAGDPRGELGVFKINKQTNAVTKVTNVGAGGVAVDPDFVWAIGGDYWSGSVYKINKTDNTLTTISGAGGDLQHVAVDSDFVWVGSNLNNWVAKIDKSSNDIVATIPVAGPYDVASDKNFVWVTSYSASFGSVSKIDKQTNSVVATIDLGPTVTSVVLDDNFVWVGSWGLYGGADAVYKIDKNNNSVVATIPVGGSGLAMDYDYVWVASRIDKSLTKINKNTGAIVSTIPLDFEANMIGDGTGFEYDFWFGGPLEKYIDSCQTLSSSGTYVLTGDVSSDGTCFTIAADDVTLDCDGHTITYATSSLGIGIAIGGYNYTTIKNCNIIQGNPSVSSASAFNLVLSSYNTFLNNTITTNGYGARGVYLDRSSNNTLNGNSITTAGSEAYGIYLSRSSDYNTFTGNTIMTTSLGSSGILLDLSSNNALTGNNVTTAGYAARGIFLRGSSSSNALTGNSITTAGSGAYGIDLHSSNHNTLSDNSITTTNSTAPYPFGISLYESSDNILNFNTITTYGNNAPGISLSSSSNNTFICNTIITSGSGTSLDWGSNYNTFTGNTITTNGSSAHGASIYSSSNNTFTNNTIITSGSNAYGAYLFPNSSYNQIWNNTFDKGPVIDQGTGNVYCIDGIGNEYINGAYYSGPDPNCGSCECPIAVEIYSCGNLNMPNTMYVLKNDINNYASGHCFTISAKNVTLDCEGHTIDGVLSGSYYGIYINQANDTIIKNCKIKEFFGGIYARGINISFYNMTVYNNGAASTGYGLYVSRASGIAVRNIETFNNTRYEIYFYQTNNTLLENANVYGTRSTATSYPIYYQGDSRDHVLRNIRVHDNVAGNYSISGMRFYGVTNVSIYNATAFNLDSLNDITYTAVGFEIYLTNNSIIDSCEVYNVSLRGLSVRNSYNNLVKDSYFHASDGAEYGNQDIRVSVDTNQPLIYCDNTFENVRITGNKTYNFYNYTTTVENVDVGAIEMCDADGSVIRNVTLASPPGSIGHNIRLEYSDNSNISDVTINGGNLLIYYSQNVNVNDVEYYNGSYANKHPGIITNFNNRFGVLFLNSSINVNDFYLHDSPYGISISNFINATLTRARIDATDESLRADRMSWTSGGYVYAGYVYGNVYDSILTGIINMTCMFGNCTDPSILNLYNTTFDSYNVDNATSMNVYWKLSVNNPLSANVVVKNATGDEIASFLDDSKDLWLMKYYVTPVNLRTNSTPHTIEASKDGYENFYTEITMDDNKEITLLLTPAIKPDLTFINGMWLTDENPVANETVNITVTVKNAGDGVSEGTVVKFYDNDQLFTTRDVNALNATGQGQDDQMILQEYASSEEGLHFIKAVVDPENAINEWDENNNEIIRVVYVGEITEIGNIIVDGYLSPDKGYHGSSIMVYGTATYNTTFGMGTEVKGGDVKITLAGSEWTTHTNSEGYYSRYIQIPMEAPMGINDVDVFITDFTLTGQKTLYLNVTNITQEPEEKPDLTIFYSDIYTAPARMVGGDNATLYVKARNVGTQDAYNVSVDIYKGESVFASDVIPYLPEGGYETLSFDMLNLEAGWFSIRVSLDEANGIDELNENNNVMERSFYVYGPDDLDLAVMDIWPSRPPFHPDNLTLYVKVYNDGEAEATDIIMNIYDGYENLGDIFIGSLASQEYKIVNVSWEEPSAGWHAIKAQIADFVNKSNEINWGNNMLTKAIYVYSEADELPDLRVLSDDITFSDDSPQPGDTITIYVNVTNAGDAASTQFLVRVSEDFTEYRETIGEKSIDSLAVGEKKTISVDYSTNLSGSHVIVAEADPYFSVADKNRLNNQATRAIVFEWPCTDEDEDGYGTGEQRTGCTYPEEDCDDADANVNPGATEICNGIDDDCDLQIDENLARECGEGACLGTQACSAGVWDACSTYGMDAGVCAVCDADGMAAYDENQDNDCEATSCPQDGCGVDTCGTNIWGDYPESVNNECSAIYACTQNTCDGTAVCGPDNDTDGWGPQCGDCNDNEASIHPGAEETWGDGIDQNCDGLVCGMKKDYSPGIGCASTATVVVNNDEELADYMTDYGFDGSQYKNLKIAYDISQMHIDIHSPCKITLKDNVVLTADTICLDGRGGILDDNGYTVNASRVALLSELGNAEFGQGSVVNADELHMKALKTVKIGLNSFAYVGGTIIMNSTGDVSSSDSVIKGGSEVTAGELIIKASRTASVGQNVKINIAGDMNVASTGDYTGSQAEFLSGAKVTVGGDLSLTSGNKALLGLNTNTTVTNNFHMNAQSENKCTISGSATYTAGSTSGNCLS